MTAPPLLDVHDLVKSYGDARVVDGVSLAIAPGECLGVIGPNGAGKTTTIRMCLGLTAPDSGQIRYVARADGAALEMPRDALATTRPMETARFGGGLDNVGGPMLASLLAQTVPYGNVATAGLAASADLATTVMPFIIRGVSLLGVASAGTARDIRDTVWQRLASDWKPAHLDTICTRETTLEGLPEVFRTMLAGGSFGRTLVRMG